ncbi:MAG TPA: methyltransferase domain-containing protein [Acidimicrobiales bacterium]|nr:methyltransferase domain-containing protein [Acidimicrobiales bacterium]
MTDRYRYGYRPGTVYESVVSLVRQFRIADATVILDIGCGFGAIAEPIRETGLTYIGFDTEESGITDLLGRGFEAQQIDLREAEPSLATIRMAVGERRVAAAVMVDALEHIPNGSEILEGIRQFSSAQGGFPLVIAVPNVTHIDIAAKLLMGRWDVTETGILDATHVAWFSADGLRQTTSDAGWVEIEQNDFELPDSDQHFPPGAAALQRGAPLHDLLASVRQQAGEGMIVNEFVRVYVPLEREKNSDAETREAPFLTVLMRTQGRREATIQEALLALAAQSSQNFELLILAHDVPRKDLGGLRYLASCFGEEFSGRVRVIPVDGGGRARPLNVGVEMARGRYLAILDDDDVVFGHWVETYERHAAKANGRVIRCAPAEQGVRPATWPGGRDGYTITSRPRCRLPERFDLLDHLFQNRTPPCSFALPRSAFVDLGIRFDESLPVVEDWDVLLRVALMSGVVDTGEVTALWRKWDKGSDSSKYVHSDMEWRQARDTIIAKLDSLPLLLPPRSVTEIVRLQSRVATLDSLRVHTEGSGALGETDWEYLLARAAIADESVRAVEVMKASTSWRVTVPIRAIGRLRRMVASWRESN